jgi:integrase
MAMFLQVARGPFPVYPVSESSRYAVSQPVHRLDAPLAAGDPGQVSGAGAAGVQADDGVHDLFGDVRAGRLFRGARGGILSESVYGRAWHTARQAALGPVLTATSLARRPYDLRHAALSRWLNATAEPARVAARAGNSVCVLHDV